MGEKEIFEAYPNLPSRVVVFIKWLLAQIRTLTESQKANSDENARLREENNRLKKENQEYKERLNLNSGNSSLPPGAEGYRKRRAKAEEAEEAEEEGVDTEADAAGPAPTAGEPAAREGRKATARTRSLRRSSGRKPGGQPGHKGHGMNFEGTPDRVEKHIPASCADCPLREECEKGWKCTAVQNEKALRAFVEWIQHWTYEASCPLRDGEKLVGEKPFEGTNRYGDSTKAFVALLFTLGVVAYERIAGIFKSLTGVAISAGTIHAIISDTDKELEKAIEYIKQGLIESELVHFDETGLPVAKLLYWLHTASNELLTYLSVQRKRGEEGMRNAGILGLFKGKAVTDCWGPYFKFIDVLHALCVAHLLRELVNRWENTGQQWSFDMIELLYQIYEEKNLLLDEDVGSFTPERMEHFKNRYDEIIAEGIKLNPIPEREPNQRGRIKKGKTRALLERMVQRKDGFLMFATDFSVPFTNNEAERSCRCARTKQNVSGCFRTEKGAENWAAIMSYLKTADKNGVSEYDAILAMFAGDSLELIRNAVEHTKENMSK
jgi:regulator of replication initiation timing